MTKTRFWRVGWVCVLAGLFAFEAAAWGPKAQQAIMEGALRMIRSAYMPEYYDRGEYRFREDILRGAKAGYDDLLQSDMNNSNDVIREITTQVRLLRDVRQYGVGSYYSFRMGQLGALVANVYLPCALEIDRSAEAAAIRELIATDADKHAESFRTIPDKRGLTYIRIVSDYFAPALKLERETSELVLSDYQSGVGGEGYMKNGAGVQFQKGVQAVADVWYTVLNLGYDNLDAPSSPEVLTWYLAKEIEYLLIVGSKPEEAEKTYQQFAAVNPGIVKAYESVGDSFYEAGLKERGVQEWKVAAKFTSPQRQSIIEKIGRYYVDQGKEQLELAADPTSAENTLDMAIESFREALSVDLTNKQTEELLQEAQVARSEKEKRRQEAIELITNMEQVMVMANRSRDEGLNEDAITKYNHVITLSEGISSEFKKQEDAARSQADDAKTAIAQILDKVLDDAQDVLDAGESDLQNKKFDDAVTKFESVPGLLSIIADDPAESRGEQKQKLVDKAAEKVDEAKRAKERWVQEQERIRREAEEAAASGGAGTAGGGAATGAGAGAGRGPGAGAGAGAGAGRRLGAGAGRAEREEGMEE